jgi:mannose-6-phosphate isomerase-like protein (cupin superfamily)
MKVGYDTEANRRRWRLHATQAREDASMIVRGSALQPIDFDGLSILDYTADAGLGSSLATIDVPPGGSHAKAWSRKSDKFYFVTRGQVRFRVGDEITDLATGDFCLVRRGTVFSYENVSRESAVLILVHTPAFDLAAEVFVD